MKVPAEELVWSLTRGREGLAGLSNGEKTGPKWVCRGLVELSTMYHGCYNYRLGLATANELVWDDYYLYEVLHVLTGQLDTTRL